MNANYSELNPALDQRVVPLFPFKGHLWAFMRCVLFHPDYAPFIPLGEQFSLAEKIIADFKGHTLTVGDIYYYIACHVEKRDPSPPGVRRAAMYSAPRPTPTPKPQANIFAGLFEEPERASLFECDEIPAAPKSIFESLMDTLHANPDPEITSQNVVSAVINALHDEPASPKEVVTAQELWEKSARDAITPRLLGAPDSPEVDAYAETIEAQQAPGLEHLFAPVEAPQAPKKTALSSLKGLFARKQPENK